MRARFFGSMVAMAAVVAVLSLAPIPAAGQQAPPKGKPWTPPELKDWNPPRTPDGQPDIQGFWNGRSTLGSNAINSYSLEDGYGPEHLRTGASQAIWVQAIIDPPDGRFPYQPWAEAIRKEIRGSYLDPYHPSRLKYIDPQTLCFLGGVPRMFYQDQNFQILQPPGYVIILHEWAHAYRVIPVDGRPHLGGNIKLWMGDSRGRWEGNTLVVELTNKNEHTWFDIVGSFHSDALRIVERYTFASADMIIYEATLTDPKVFTRPVTIRFPLGRHKQEGWELIEYACVEGEQSSKHMLLQPESTPGPSR